MNVKFPSDYEFLPAYMCVADDLRNKLDAGIFPVGVFLPSELELSKAYGLSRGTIRKALEILVSERRISRQRGRGTIVLAPQKHRRPQIAVVWSIVRAVGADMLAGLESAIAEADYDLLFSTSEHQPDKEVQILERLLHSDVAGIVLYATGAMQSNDLLQAIITNEIPIVLIDRFTPALADQISWVTSENEQGAYEVTQHLIELEHRRIAFVLWTPDNENVSTLIERRNGYFRALKESGLDPDTVPVLSVCGEKFFELGKDGFVDKFFAFLDEHGPTAVFFHNDAAALRIDPFIEKHGIRIPEELSTAAFDRLLLPHGVNPQNLTTVSQDFRALGRETGRAILQQIQDPTQPPLHIRVPVKLHIGTTTGIAKTQINVLKEVL